MKELDSGPRMGYVAFAERCIREEDRKWTDQYPTWLRRSMSVYFNAEVEAGWVFDLRRYEYEDLWQVGESAMVR